MGKKTKAKRAKKKKVATRSPQRRVKKKRGPSAKKKAAKPRKSAASKGTGKDVNKSQAIRDLLEAQPQLKPALIAALLQERGVNVSPQYVSMIKSNLKKRSRRTSRKFDTNASISLQQLVEVRGMIDKVGGVEQMERILDLIRELQ